MTKEELLFRLRQVLANQSDIEADHQNADQLLVEYINDEEVQVYNHIRKWYA